MTQLISYLFSDMDGTLLDSRKKISEETIRSIERFISRGGHFAVATGRSPEITRPLIGGVPVNAPCILFNGAGVYDFSAEKFLYQEFLPSDIVQSIYETALKAYPMTCIEAFAEGPIHLLNRDCVMDHYIIEEQQPSQFFTYSGEQRYMKLLLYAQPEELQKVYRKLVPLLSGKVSYTFSAPFYLEILPLGVSKGTALNWLCEELNIDRENTASIGDFDNDAEMLRYSGLGAAPANASPAAKAAAKCLVPSNDEHCVSYFLEHFICAKQ